MAMFGDLCPTAVEVTDDIAYIPQLSILFVAEHGQN